MYSIRVHRSRVGSHQEKPGPGPVPFTLILPSRTGIHSFIVKSEGAAARGERSNDMALITSDREPGRVVFTDRVLTANS